MSYALSVVLYPLFVPTYLMAGFVITYAQQVAPLSTHLACWLILGTLGFTCLIPMAILAVLILLGRVQNMDVTNRHERTLPYMLSLASLVCWACMLIRMRVPIFLSASAVSTILVLCIVMLINLRWKISVHLASAGGAVAMIVGMMLYFGISNPLWLIVSLVATLLLQYARIYLRAHTPAQVVAGWLLGLLTVLIPNLLLLW